MTALAERWERGSLMRKATTVSARGNAQLAGVRGQIENGSDLGHMVAPSLNHFTYPSRLDHSLALDIEQRGLIGRSLAALVSNAAASDAGVATRTECDEALDEMDDAMDDASSLNTDCTIGGVAFSEIEWTPAACTNDAQQAIAELVSSSMEAGLNHGHLTASDLAAMDAVGIDALPRVAAATDPSDPTTPTSVTAWLCPDGAQQEANAQLDCISVGDRISLGDEAGYDLPQSKLDSSGQIWAFAVEDIGHALQEAARRAKRRSRELAGQRQKAEARNKKDGERLPSCN